MRLTLLGDVVDQQRAHCPTVVCASDGSVPLLAGCVPDLGLDCLPVDLLTDARLTCL